MNPVRHVELDIDIGADAKDWSAIQAGEKLKPVEAELRRIEETVGEIVIEMDYLREREQKLRDTNESTNERVKWFAIGTMGMLIALGVWQVIYLRAYFRFVEDSETLNGHVLMFQDPSISSERFTARSLYMHKLQSLVIVDNAQCDMTTVIDSKITKQRLFLPGQFIPTHLLLPE